MPGSPGVSMPTVLMGELLGMFYVLNVIVLSWCSQDQLVCSWDIVANSCSESVKKSLRIG